MSRSVAHPDRLIERLSGAFTDLVDLVRIGVDSAVGLPAKQRWEGKALPILVQNLTDLQKEIHQYQSSDAGPLQSRVSRLRFLAREMDGYSLECFSKEVAGKILQSRNLVVLFAWQIHEASNQGPA